VREIRATDESNGRFAPGLPVMVLSGQGSRPIVCGACRGRRRLRGQPEPVLLIAQGAITPLLDGEHDLSPRPPVLEPLVCLGRLSEWEAVLDHNPEPAVVHEGGK
jgi:hypothetical protein